MKYTISGFSQLAAVNFNLDSVDLHMLRWIVDFIDSNRMRSMTLDGEKYYWVSYQGLIDDLPILYLKKDAIYKRLKRMCELGILKKKTVFLVRSFLILHMVKILMSFLKVMKS